MLDSLLLLKKITFPAIYRKQIDVLQINLGYRCNQQCLHCHVNAGPNRKEEMSHKVVQQTLDFIKKNKIKVVDLTGGAPEMHPEYGDILHSLYSLGVKIIDRCNLTILNEVGYESLAQKLADNAVEIVASLPCYLEENVNKQRGKGVFDSSIKALQTLNQLGYGLTASNNQISPELILNLVYNPQDASLSPNQEELEKNYKTFLFEQFGITFNHLFTMTNVPVKRFGSLLISKEQFYPYMTLLQNAHQVKNLEGLMCRYQLSVDWQGYLYDCDFNQMLDLSLKKAGKKQHISDLCITDLEHAKISVAGHCYACTAGQGSSCGGALVE
jgi:radical SAM/Cys-rich protein